jgi:hypothetical protein
MHNTDAMHCSAQEPLEDVGHRDHTEERNEEMHNTDAMHCSAQEPTEDVGHRDHTE